MTRAVVFTCVVALAVFAVIQDRLTVAGVGRYIALQREALAGGRPPVNIDTVMEPAVAHGVRQGAVWSGVVLVGGIGGTLVSRRRRIRD